LIASCAIATRANAHNPFEVDVAAGYRLPGGIDVDRVDADDMAIDDGRLSAEGSFVVSGTVGYRLQPDGFIYLTYSRTQTTFAYEADGSAGGSLELDGSIEYFQFGGNVEKTMGVIVPYMGFSLGLGRIAGSGIDSRLFFAPVIDGGFKFDVHEHIHLRLLGRVPILFATKDVICTDAQCLHAAQLRPLAQIEVLGGVGVSF
jgi:hypothetical protein